MSDEQREIERLRRIREGQLGSRDPLNAEKKRSHIASGRPRARFSLVDELRYVPAKVTWTLYGVLFGVFVGWWAGDVIREVYGTDWKTMIILAAVVVAGGAGFVMGRAKDTGKEDWRK